MISDDDGIAYLTRLGVEREPPSVEALARLHRAHVERVPYETTWIHMGQLWGVDRTESLHRIVHHGTGGYCFHLNGAFSLLLEWLGYAVTLHVGGVHGPDGPTEALMHNHLVLQVHNLASEECPNGTWYVDAGLGDALHEALPLAVGSYLQEPLAFEIVASETNFADWQFRHDVRGSFHGMAFDSTPAAMGEFVERNVFLSTSPDSGFAKVVTVQRRDATGIDILRGQVLSRVGTEASEDRTVSRKQEWFELLRDMFGLRFDHVSPAATDKLWQRVNTTHEEYLARRSIEDRSGVDDLERRPGD